MSGCGRIGYQPEPLRIIDGILFRQLAKYRLQQLIRPATNPELLAQRRPVALDRAFPNPQSISDLRCRKTLADQYKNLSLTTTELPSRVHSRFSSSQTPS